MLSLSEFDTGTAKVMAVRLGSGCPEGCAQCGVYEKDNHPGDFILKEVSAQRIAALLLQEVQEVIDDQGKNTAEESGDGDDGIVVSSISPDDEIEQREGGEGVFAVTPGLRFIVNRDTREVWFEDIQGQRLDATALKPIIDTRTRLLHYLDTYVTTDVNQEPLAGDAFLYFSKLVKLLSDGKSRAVCVSHGLRANRNGGVAGEYKKYGRRLDEIVEFMDSDSLFVLSLDRARSGGRITHQVNVRSYAETLQRLKPLLDKGTRLTVSVQGTDDSSSDLYRVKALKMWTEIKTLLIGEYGWTQDEVGRIHTDSGRDWTSRGRAKGLPGVKPENACPVVPDNQFVSRHMDMRHSLMVALDAPSGEAWKHAHNAPRTYNDLSVWSRYMSRLRPGLPTNGWEQLRVNDDPLADLSGEFVREAKSQAFKALRLTAGAKPGPSLAGDASGSSGTREDENGEGGEETD